ncbi:hypothetical protein V8C34DRAFT_266605 [Trichoderma compactum]
MSLVVFLFAACWTCCAGRIELDCEYQPTANRFFFPPRGIPKREPSRQRLCLHSKSKHNRNSSLCGKSAALAGSRVRERVA